MNSTTLALLILGAVTSVIGTIVFLKNLRASPEGYEDSEGFHYGRPSDELVIRTTEVRIRAYEHAA